MEECATPVFCSQLAVRSAYNDPEPDATGKAATLLRSLAKDHAFKDGNKRLAMLSFLMFLDKNGYVSRAQDNAWVSLVSGVAAHEGSYPMKALYAQFRRKIRQQPYPDRESLVANLRRFIDETVTGKGGKMWATDQQDQHGRPLQVVWIERREGMRL